MQLYTEDQGFILGNIVFQYNYEHNGYRSNDENLLRKYQNLIDNFGREDGDYWYDDWRGPLRDAFKQIIIDMARKEFSEISNEDFESLRQIVTDRVYQAIHSFVQEHDLPIVIEDLNMSQVRLSPSAQTSIIVRKVEEQRQSVNYDYDFTTDITEFFNEMKDTGLSGDQIMEAYCLHMVDRASREGRDMNTDCLRPEVNGYDPDSP